MRYFNLTILSVLLAIPQCLFAQQVSESEAKSKALSFFNKPTVDGVRRAPVNESNIKLAYTAAENGSNYFYVYNNGENGGFVIVGGDQQAKDILAYVPQGHFDYESAPENVIWWLNQYEKEIAFAKKALQSRPNYAPSFSDQSRRIESVIDRFRDIPDLLTTKWNQQEPYNIKIPAIHHTNGDSIISPTGCVNTAIAQIMNYWKWPISGTGSYSYILDYDKLDEWSAGSNPGAFDGLLPTTFSADFGGTTYDWENMLDTYDGVCTQQQIDAVSKLMYHIGVAGYTLYGPSGSGGGVDRIMEALQKYFRYSHHITYLTRGDYLDDEWEEIIYSELLAGRPVYYEANSHAFLIHGYNSELKMFSVNWGWGGFMDGYYRISSTNNPYFFNNENYDEDYTSHGICINIEPDNIVRQNAFANVGDTITVDGIRYDLIGPISKTVEVTYAPNDQIIYEGELTIPESISYNNETYKVTKIGRYALGNSKYNYYGILLGGSSRITEIHLPSTLRSIAMGGLAQCNNIQDLLVPESVEMLAGHCFDGMKNLKTITLPNQLPYLPHYCFWQCRSLQSIILPATIQAFGYMSLNDCPSLEYIILHSSEVPTVQGGELSFPSSLENKVLAVPQDAIEKYRNDSNFKLWGNIVSLDSIPEHFGKTIIANKIRYKVLLSGDEVSAIGFNGESIDTLLIPGKITFDGHTFNVSSIGYQAFKGQSINTLIIEDGVQEINEGAFKSGWMSSIELSGTIERIGDESFANCQSLKSVLIHNGVKSIGEFAFSGCWQLKSIELPNSVDSIGQNAFSYCDNLEYVKLSSALTTLPVRGFERARKIKTLILPLGLKSIEYHCFNDCNELTTIICYASDVPSLIEPEGWHALPPNIQNGTLYVPAESVSAYKSVNGWQDWGTILPLVAVDSIYLEDISIEKLYSTPIPMRTTPSEITDGQIFYTSSNPSVAKISRDGMITAIEVGQTTIKAESLEGHAAICTITVTPTDLLGMGGVGNVHWRISGDSVLTVYGTGTFDWNDTSFETYRSIVKKAHILNGINLGHYALGWCQNLITVELPSDITSIGNSAFIGCNNLQYIKCNSTLPPNTDSSFNDVSTGLPVFVPSGYASQYRTDSGWSIFNKIIESNYAIAVSANNEYGYATVLQYPSCESDTAIIEASGYYGYIFSHWSDGCTDSHRTIVLSADTALSACFTPGYHVYFYNIDGSFLQQVDVKAGETPVYEGEIPTRYGDEGYHYVFTGWSPSLEPATYDSYYYAQFELEYYRYNVVFQDYDGTILQQDSVQYGQYAYYSGKEPSRQSNDQYTYWFREWYPSNTFINSDKVFVAQYDSIINIYQLSYIVDGKVIQSYSIEYGSTLPMLDNPTKEGYTFSGWSEIPATMPANEVNVTGSFRINKYLLTYKVDGETVSTDSVTYASAVTAKENPTKEGYAFSGWSGLPVIMPATDVIVTGNFTINSYVITYMVDNEVYHTDTIVYNGAIPSIAAPEKEGFIFESWINLPEIMPASDIVVTAEFTIDDGIVNTEITATRRVYDINGRFLGEMTDDEISLLKPGIYIVNNKKRVIQ